LRLSFHRRRELFVLGGQLRVQQEEFLDLLHTGELAVHAIELGLESAPAPAGPW
jgi:hypothetical protein